MFVVLLKFSENKNKAAELMDAHNLWIKSGFEEGIFLLAGSLQPNLGGSIIAHGISDNRFKRLDLSDTKRIFEYDPKSDSFTNWNIEFAEESKPKV